MIVRTPALARRFALALVATLSPAAACFAAEATPPVSEAPAQDSDRVSNCISLHTIRSTKVLDGQTIVFELSGKRTVVNRLPRNCPGLKFEKRFLYKTSLNQLCSQDIITVLTGPPHFRGASCGLGKFEPWTPPQTSDETPDQGTLTPEP